MFTTANHIRHSNAIFAWRCSYTEMYGSNEVTSRPARIALHNARLALHSARLALLKREVRVMKTRGSRYENARLAL